MWSGASLQARRAFFLNNKCSKELVRVKQSEVHQARASKGQTSCTPRFRFLRCLLPFAGQAVNMVRSCLQSSLALKQAPQHVQRVDMCRMCSICATLLGHLCFFLVECLIICVFSLWMSLFLGNFGLVLHFLPAPGHPIQALHRTGD